MLYQCMFIISLVILFPHLAFADCGQYVEAAENYYHHEFISASANDSQYVLNKIGDDRWPIRFDLSICADGTLSTVSGWNKKASTTVESIFWSNNLDRLFISTHEFDDQIKGQSGYGNQNSSIAVLQDGSSAVIANHTTHHYHDSDHQPIVLIGRNQYVNDNNEIKVFKNMPRYGVTKSLPETDWYYSIGWDDGYEYANVVKIEKINEDYIATRSIHITEKPSWFEKILVFIFDLDMLYRSEVFTDVIFYNEHTSVAFDEEQQKLYFYENGTKTFIDPNDY